MEKAGPAGQLGQQVLGFIPKSSLLLVPKGALPLISCSREKG